MWFYASNYTTWSLKSIVTLIDVQRPKRLIEQEQRVSVVNFEQENNPRLYTLLQRLRAYSNTTKRALVWTKELSELNQIVQEYAGTKFNSCLLNLKINFMKFFSLS
jgi:hypothetical protein